MLSESSLSRKADVDGFGLFGIITATVPATTTGALA